MKANRWHAAVVLLGVAGCGEVAGLPDAPFSATETATYRLETFQAFDRNGDGVLSVEEYVPSVDELMAQMQAAGRKVSRNRLERERQSYFTAFAAMDRNGDGRLELSEFGG